MVVEKNIHINHVTLTYDQLICVLYLDFTYFRDLKMSEKFAAGIVLT